MQITADELLRSFLTNSAYLTACPDCSGSGTRFNQASKSSMCKRCQGKRRLVKVPREPAEVEYSREWEDYFKSNPGNPGRLIKEHN